LEWLGEEVSKHLACGAVGNREVLTTGMVRDKKIAYSNMTGSLTTGLFSVAFHLDGTFIVLVEDSFSIWIALGLHEHLDV
jgi:hypothetical protein